jgi:Ca2+-binding RTX toxin-like protein
MAINIPSSTTQFEIVESDETYTIDTNVTVDVDGNDAILASDTVTNDELFIKGKVLQSGDGFAAIRTDAVNMKIHIEKDGSVIGTNGIYSEGPEPGSLLEITVDGLLEATGADGYAIQTADSKEVVVNHGTITGKIHLGSGEDIFDNRGGTVSEGIEGGAGDDTLIVDSADTLLIENGGSEGYDTVQSTVSYTLSENVEQLILLGKKNLNGTGNDDQSDLVGNRGKNILSALDGNDILDGGRGADKLDGGDGADTFVFKTGHGKDTIMDFENGVDFIDVSEWQGIDDFSDIEALMSSSNGDVVIKMGKDVLRIADTLESDIDQNDFIFDII